MAAELDEREKLFVEHYVAHLSPRAAAEFAGYSKRTARTNAYLWVSTREYKPHVYDAIQAGLQAKRGEATVSREMIVERLRLIAYADPNELIEMRRINCRYCWGEGHGYQWREREFNDAVEMAEAKGKPLPDYAGGFGYRHDVGPHPDCPECCGDGFEMPIPRDTRELSPGARALYAGVEVTKNGLKVKMHDQKAALDSLARIEGLFIDRKELSGPGGGPVVIPATIRLVAGPAPAPKADDE